MSLIALQVYTAWNYRREALAPVLDAGGEAAVAAAAGELALTERALLKNPKSYATWHHRRWVVAKGLSSLEHELKLVGGGWRVQGGLLLWRLTWKHTARRWGRACRGAARLQLAHRPAARCVQPGTAPPAHRTTAGRPAAAGRR